MVEALDVHELGDDVDEGGNFLKELAEGESLNNVVWKLDKQRQGEVAPYIDLTQKIASLPAFERNAVGDIISEFINSYPEEDRDKLKESGIVQHMIHSSRPLSFWQNSNFKTPDGKFEQFLNNRIRPAVEEMLADFK